MEYISYDVLVVGTGAAGYNAANRIKQFGKKSVAIITEGINCGTSRNTGSDKQTYYKLGLGGDTPDSVARMAENLFACGSVDGDTALCEASLSARCFLNLAELGVEFPVNRYGEYIGYKTDHDPYARATSAGPLTSKYMTEALQKNAEKLGVEVLSGLLAIEILKNNNRVCGLICLEIESGKLQIFKCDDIIWATGGPAGIYADSVYPKCHTGSTSPAFAAGAHLQNMTEWQYGLASTNPRWNVSGTYMQVLPRFVSVGEDGEENEFLLDFFGDEYKALSAVFLKGYQWPFDSRKVLEGSSVIDLLVYRECVLKKRRVFLDYTENPFGLKNIEFEKLSNEAYEYLNRAEACFGTPIERLEKMNAPAIELYKSKGVSLTNEYLEIALCAQHNNGGIAVDMWWQTALKGLFAAGECAGTHGITRPGGSALNAGQAGSLRAAQYISFAAENTCAEEDFTAAASAAAEKQKDFCSKMLANSDNVNESIAKAQRIMSDNGGAIRRADSMLETENRILSDIADFGNKFGVSAPKELYKAYKLLDILRMQAGTLTAMIDFSERIGSTRGSALYCDENGEKRAGLEEIFRFKAESGETANQIQEICCRNGEISVLWRDVRPIPQNDDFFENVWRQYRENKNIY